MTEHAQKEGIVPPCGLDFLAHRHGCRMGSNNVECEPSEDCEVFRGVVFARPASVLVEDDIENPVQLVLNVPVPAHDLKQPLGRHVFGEDVVPHEGRLRTAPMGPSARSDACQRNDARKVMRGSELGVVDNSGAPPFAPIVGGRFQGARQRCACRRGRSAGPTAANSFP
jgi:hypothetical protein